MPDNNTSEMSNFQEEKAHLEAILEIAKREYAKIKCDKVNLKSDIMEKRRYMWNELGAVATDVSSNYEMIAQNHEIASSELFYDDMITRGKILKKQLDCPYFARIDFKEDGYSQNERIYIGKYGMTDKQNYDVVVCDWRSDIASMYYNYETGRALFVCENGTIEGDLNLKRQFTIENGVLQSMFDTSVAIEDNFLMTILNSHSSDKMKTIVSSIQKMQNEIIREDSADILIINGCAGSGKTSIALHRVAYLLYKSREHLSEKNFLIFSPNEIFSSYISGVLPDLGEQNVWQSTFVQFSFSAFSGMLTPQSYLDFINNQNDMEIYLAKNSKDFCEFLTREIGNILESVIFNDIKLHGKIIMTADEIKAIFNDNASYLNYHMVYSRVYEILIKKASTYKRSIQNIIEDELIEKNGATYYTSDKDLALNVRFEYIKAIEAMKKAFKETYQLEPSAIYIHCLNEFFDKSYSNLFDLELQRKYIRYEDISPLLYIMAKLGYLKKNHEILHVVIDEAQDYTYMQHTVIKYIFSQSKFTILGDVNQKLCDNGNFCDFFTENTDKTLSSNTNIGAKSKHLIKEFDLNTNYRSSKEIVQYTNSIVKKELCMPIERQAGPVISKSIIKNYPQEVKIILTEFLTPIYENDKFKSKTAIITKSKQQAELIFSMIDFKDCSLVCEEKHIISGNCCVITVNLAKGLEFDNVLVINQKLDKNHFYIACTRALHNLWVVEDLTERKI